LEVESKNIIRHVNLITVKVSDRAINVLVALFCLFPGYYFYRQNIRERVPAFLVDPVRASIVESSGAKLSDLAVLYRGKPVGDRSVTAIRVYFWNDGKMPITKSDVLRPLQCVLAEGTDILDYRLLKTSRDITNIRLSRGNDTSNDRILVDFDILEKDDGAAIQIIYAGAHDAAIHFEGIVVGAPQPTLKTIRDRSSDNKEKNDRKALGIVLMLLGTLLGLIAWIRFAWMRSGWHFGFDADTPVEKVWLRKAKHGANFLVNASFIILPLVCVFLAAFVAFYNPRALAEVPSAIVTEK
jgi:hypothetical protein